MCLKKRPHLFMLWFNDFKCTKLFLIYFLATQKKKITGGKKIVKRKIFTCKIIVIIILICQKLGSVGPVQQKFKLPLPNLDLSKESGPKCITMVNFHTYQLNSSIWIWMNLVFQIVGRSHRWLPVFNNVMKNKRVKTAALVVFFLWLVKSLKNL